MLRKKVLKIHSSHFHILLHYVGSVGAGFEKLEFSRDLKQFSNETLGYFSEVYDSKEKQELKVVMKRVLT